MKTKGELNGKPAELSDDELGVVSGGKTLRPEGLVKL